MRVSELLLELLLVTKGLLCIYSLRFLVNILHHFFPNHSVHWDINPPLKNTAPFFR